MLALFLVLLSFGSYCISAPAPTPEPVAKSFKTHIREALTKIDAMKQSKFQELSTPTYVTKEECIHTNLNLFIEEVKSLSHSTSITLLLSSLKYIQKELRQLFPEPKGSQPDCDHGEVSLEDFKKKFENFLTFTNQLVQSKS